MLVGVLRRFSSVLMLALALMVAQPALAATVTTVSTSPNPSVSYETFTITAKVTGDWTVGDTVDFYVGNGFVGSDTLDASGEATFTRYVLPGPYNIQAWYIDSNTSDDDDSSIGYSQHTGIRAPTTTTLVSSQNPVAAYTSFSLTATATGSVSVHSGSITFYDGVTVIGAASVNASGQATLQVVAGLAPGSHSLTARFGGDDYSAESTSVPLTQSVNTIASTTSLSSSVNPSTLGQPVTFTATVSGSAATPTGTVTFSVDGTTVASGVTMSAGQASFTTTALAAGQHDVVASYAGDSFYKPSSTSLTQSVIDSAAVATELIEDFFETRAKLILGNGPDRGRRIDRLNAIAPAAGNPADALLGLMPLVKGGPTTLSGSLGAIEQATGAAPAGAPAPFDLWFETTFGRYGDAAGDGGFGLAYFGADYLVSPDLLVGALFQLDQVDFNANGSDVGADGTGWMIGPYVTGRLGDNLYFDLRAQAGRSANSISPYGTYTDEVDASRWLVEASISGQWQAGDWTFEPTARLSYFEETSDDYTDGLGMFVPSVTTGTGQLALGPALSYRFVTDGEVAVVVGAGLDGVLDFGLEDGTLATDGAHAELSTDIDLMLPGGARLGASVNLGGLGDGDFRFLSGTVRVSAALR